MPDRSEINVNIASDMPVLCILKANLKKHTTIFFLLFVLCVTQPLRAGLFNSTFLSPVAPPRPPPGELPPRASTVPPTASSSRKPAPSKCSQCVENYEWMCDTCASLQIGFSVNPLQCHTDVSTVMIMALYKTLTRIKP